MTDYTPCHRPSDRYDADEVTQQFWSEAADDEQEFNPDRSDQDYFEYEYERWMIDDLSDRAQTYEQASPPEAEPNVIPFPELIEVAIQVAEAAATEF